MIENREFRFAWVYGACLAFVVGLTVAASPAHAASAEELKASADAALQALYADTPEAQEIASKATAILVFPEIAKGGLIVGAEYGDGVLLRGGESAGHYNIAAASIGFQAGIQSFSYVMMFLDEESLGYLDSANGWEIGAGPSIVAVDKGMAASLTSATLKDAVYAFVFGQQGLMGGAGLQGSKITAVE